MGIKERLAKLEATNKPSTNKVLFVDFIDEPNQAPPTAYKADGVEFIQHGDEDTDSFKKRIESHFNGAGGLMKVAYSVGVNDDY